MLLDAPLPVPELEVLLEEPFFLWCFFLLVVVFVPVCELEDVWSVLDCELIPEFCPL